MSHLSQYGCGVGIQGYVFLFFPLRPFLWILSFILFAITAAGVVPIGGPKNAPRTSYKVQIIFSFWSFERILSSQKLIIGLD